jgi:hypothetical protein
LHKHIIGEEEAAARPVVALPRSSSSENIFPQAAIYTFQIPPHLTNLLHSVNCSFPTYKIVHLHPLSFLTIPPQFAVNTHCSSHWAVNEETPERGSEDPNDDIHILCICNYTLRGY